MKLIDWSKVPRGTMTNYGELIAVNASVGEGQVLRRFNGDGDYRIRDVELPKLRIVPSKLWSHHEAGDDCPLPDGLLVEYKGFDLNHGTFQAIENHVPCCAFAYRITGVDRAGGFTDDPAEVTE